MNIGLQIDQANPCLVFNWSGHWSEKGKDNCPERTAWSKGVVFSMSGSSAVIIWVVGKRVLSPHGLRKSLKQPQGRALMSLMSASWVPHELAQAFHPHLPLPASTAPSCPTAAACSAGASGTVAPGACGICNICVCGICGTCEITRNRRNQLPLWRVPIGGHIHTQMLGVRESLELSELPLGLGKNRSGPDPKEKNPWQWSQSAQSKLPSTPGVLSGKGDATWSSRTHVQPNRSKDTYGWENKVPQSPPKKKKVPVPREAYGSRSLNACHPSCNPPPWLA